MVGYVEMSVGYSNAGAFGGDGSCAVCVVAGGSVGCGAFEGISKNDAKAAVFAECQGVDPGGGAVDAVATSDCLPSSGSSVLGVCFGVDRKLRVEIAKMVDVIPISLTLFLFLSFGVLLWWVETGVEEEPWPYVGWAISMDPITAVGNQSA